MKPKEPRPTNQIKDLPPKAVKPESTDQVRGGRAGGDDLPEESLQYKPKLR